MDEWMNIWMDRWVDERMDGWIRYIMFKLMMDGSVIPPVFISIKTIFESINLLQFSSTIKFVFDLTRAV